MCLHNHIYGYVNKMIVKSEIKGLKAMQPIPAQKKTKREGIFPLISTFRISLMSSIMSRRTQAVKDSVVTERGWLWRSRCTCLAMLTPRSDSIVLQFMAKTKLQAMRAAKRDSLPHERAPNPWTLTSFCPSGSEAHFAVLVQNLWWSKTFHGLS